MSSLQADRLPMPEPMTGLKPVRQERQRWQRLGRAEGELDIGYDAEGRPVRIEYHWVRQLSRANPVLQDVYTAELWVRQADGDWLYLLRPDQSLFKRVAHAEVRSVLAKGLGLDTGA